MARYVILRHDPEQSSSAVHWDFMIETGPALRTWALESEPSAGRNIPAAALPDHRLAYLDYEGPISGNRGNVTRCAAGSFEIIAETPARLELRLTGDPWSGLVAICQDAAIPQRWTFDFSV
jgi:DNA polymerase Ligase (LigD)